MEHSALRLIQLIQFVYSFTGRHIEQHAVRQHQLVVKTESGFIFSILIRNARR